MNNKLLLLVALCFLVLFSAQVQAISANGAVNYVAMQNHFLYLEEQYEQPNVKVSYSNKLYWVIPVTLNDELVVLFAVEEQEGTLSEEKGTNRHLFRTSAVLRDYTSMKKTISLRSDIRWLITTEFSRIFSDLGNSLQGEVSDLGIIKTAVSDSDITSKANSMSSKLISMSLKCNTISAAINEALAFEAEFFSEANVTEYEELKDKLNIVFNLIADLDNEAKDYKDDVNDLRQMISIQDELDSQDKSFLIDKADPGEEFNKIGGYSITALQLEASIEAVYTNIQKNIDSYLEEFEQRLKMNEAYALIYEDNESLTNKTDGAFSDLQGAADYILDEERSLQWKDRDALSTFSSYWEKTEEYFNKRDYENAIEYGAKAIKEAADVYNNGFYSDDSEPIFTEELIFNLIVLLVIAIIILYSINNKEKILAFLTGGKNKEEDLEI